MERLATISTVLTCLVFLLLSEPVLGGGKHPLPQNEASDNSQPCSYDARHSKAITQNQSSFRGIGFARTPDEVKLVVAELGFYPEPSFYVGSNTLVSTVHIWSKVDEVGLVSFDRSGRMLRLSLKDSFFCTRPMFVRRFVDELFKHYGVDPIEERDDVCFQDVTCFKGVSIFGEQFLILRIGTTAELYVRPASVGGREDQK